MVIVSKNPLKVSVSYKCDWNGKLPPDDSPIFFWVLCISVGSTLYIDHLPTKPTLRQVRNLTTKVKKENLIFEAGLAGDLNYSLLA